MINQTASCSRAQQACSLGLKPARLALPLTRPPSVSDIGIVVNGELHTAYTFAVQRTPRGQPANSLVVLERRGRAAAWAYLSCAFPTPTRVLAGTWEARLGDGEAAHTHSGGLGGLGGSHAAVLAASPVVELWALPLQQQQEVQRQQQQHHQHQQPGQRQQGRDARAALAAARDGVGRPAGAAPEASGQCRRDREGEDGTARWVAEVLMGLHEQGMERLRIVGSVGVATRDRLAREGVPGALQAVRAAGCVVMDLVGMLLGPGDGGKGPGQGCKVEGADSSNSGAQGRRQGESPGGTGVQAGGPMEGRGAVRSVAEEELEAWEQEARRRLAAAEGGGGAERSGVLCGLVEALGGTWPEVQVLLLPALVPPTGRWET